MRKNKPTHFFILVGCNVLIFIFLVFLGRLFATVFVYFNIGSFLFDWKETVFISLKKGVAIVFTLGLGLWIKARIQERKGSKRPNQ